MCSKLMDRVISVEYAIKDDDDRRNGSPNGGRDRSPRRRGDDRGSPRRERGSPDYGRGRDRGSPDYGRGGRGRSPSPHRRDRGSPDYGRGASPAPNGKDRNTDYRRDSSASPNGRVRNAGRRDASPSPRRERERSPRRGRGSIPKERVSPEYEPGAIISPRDEGRISDSPREASPGAILQHSPNYSGGAETPPERRYRRYVFLFEQIFEPLIKKQQLVILSSKYHCCISSNLILQVVVKMDSHHFFPQNQNVQYTTGFEFKM